MSYAIAYINSVEYGPGPRKRDHFPWDKKSRAKFTERDLEKALNEAYEAGRLTAYDNMRGFLEGFPGGEVTPKGKGPARSSPGKKG